MNALTGKFSKVIKKIEADRGPFLLFALLQREDTSDYWDVVVSAAWIDRAGLNGLRYITDEITKVLENSEILELSRIVPMQVNDGAVRALASWAARQSLPIEVSSFEFSGARIRLGYILAANYSGDRRITNSSIQLHHANT